MLDLNSVWYYEAVHRRYVEDMCGGGMCMHKLNCDDNDREGEKHLVSGRGVRLELFLWCSSRVCFVGLPLVLWVESRTGETSHSTPPKPPPSTPIHWYSLPY